MTLGRRRDALITLTIAACALVYYLAYFNYEINPSDEGYLCYGTHRVLDGQTPGADFHAYEPGRYWVLAPFFLAFGEDVVVERAVLLFLRVLICVFAYMAARCILPIPLAVIAIVPSLLVPGPWHKTWFSLIMLAAYLLAQLHINRPHEGGPWLGGLVAGAGFVFRLDIGIFATLIWVVAMIAAARKADDRAGFGRQMTRFTIAAVGPIAAACVVMVFQGGLFRAVTFYVYEYLNASSGLERIHPKIAGFPSLVDGFRKAPTDLFELMIWLSMASALLLAVVITIRWRRESSAPAPLLLLWIAWACAFAGVYFQPDRSHLLQNGPLLWIVMASSFFLVENEVRRRGRCAAHSYAWCSGLFTTVIFGALVAENLFSAGINSYYTGSIRMRFGPHERSRLPHASLKLDPWVNEEYQGVLDFINDHTKASDGIATCFCLPMFNFLGERDNPTNLDILFPHTVGRADQQRRFLDNLSGVRLLIVNPCEFNHDRPRHCPADDHTLEDFAPAVVAHIETEWRPVFTSSHGFVTIYGRRSSFP